jgi:hypothetical protein
MVAKSSAEIGCARRFADRSKLGTVNMTLFIDTELGPEAQRIADGEKSPQS